MVGSLSARALHEGVPVAIADDWCTLGGSVAYRIGELYLFQECLHFLVECSTSDDDFVELATEGFDNLLTNLLADLLGNDGHGEQEAHAVVLNLGEHLLADYLLDDQRYGDDDLGLDIGKGLCDDGRRGDAVEVIDMAAMQELEDELEGHAVHVGHGENGDDAVATVDGLAQYVLGKVIVGPEGTVGYHDTLGETGGAGGVVDHRHFLAILFLVIVDMFLTEILGELLAVQLVEVLTGIGKLIGTGNH